MASNNMYRVGDYVYFESSATAPYQIRRIDELNKTPTGAVEAKVACYFRRRDVSSALINQAEKYYVSDLTSDEDNCGSGPEYGAGNKASSGGALSNGSAGGKSRNSLSSAGGTGFTEVQRHRIKHRELFLSRQIECLPATHIRGKCSVTLHNDAEPLVNYLAREDTFYYKLIYDPSLKTLQEDRGAMRIGSDHQSDVEPLLKDKSADSRLSEIHETLVWQPSSLISEQEVDLFCLLAKSVGTYGRSCETASVARQPHLLGAATSASRDSTRQFAHDLLHRSGYNLVKAIGLLLPGGQPTVVRDQLEDWSAGEAQLFEEALDKYSKTFPDIQSECLPWKSHKSLVELYYLWKTTDRYVRQRRTKLAAQEHKLKQVYIPNYSKPNPAVLYSGSDKAGRGCEGCSATSSSQWYAWGAQNLLYRLCASCWSYWKRYGGLKNLGSRDRARGPHNASALDADSRLDCTEAGGETGNSLRNVCPSSSSVFTNKSTAGAPYSQLMAPIASGAPASVSARAAAAAAASAAGEFMGGSSTAGVATTANVPGSSPAAWFGGGPRGTQCFRTPSFVRMARVLCPSLLVQPRRLARRPGKPSALPSVQAGNSSAADMLDSTGCVSLPALKLLAQPVIARLPDPAAVLSQTRKIPPVDGVIKAIAQRRNVELKDIDFSLVLGFKSPIATATSAAVQPQPLPQQQHQLNNGPIDPVRPVTAHLTTTLKRSCPENHHADDKDNENGDDQHKVDGSPDGLMNDTGPRAATSTSKDCSSGSGSPPCKKQVLEQRPEEVPMEDDDGSETNGLVDGQRGSTSATTTVIKDVTCA